jgi:hypothetical protein
MALQTIPGFTGFQYARFSSMDKRAIGKFTDSNHLESFHDIHPSDYDKKIISIYTQSSLYSNDFLDMINQSTPYYVGGLSDAWRWKIEKPYQFPQIVAIPEATATTERVGIDEKEFEIVHDTEEFQKNAVVILGHKMYGRRLYATSDPIPYTGRSWLQKFKLISPNPQADWVDKKFLQQGIQLELSHHNIGEFDQDLGGLRKLADIIEMYETLGSGDGLEHKITAWADDKMLRDGAGNPLDLLVYYQKRRNELPTTRHDIRWEPFVEFMMRKQMVEQKVNKMIWGQPGSVRTNGGKQELKKESAGVHYRMRNSGNYVPVNKGEFGPNLLRSVFGDLFYRREDMKDRQVKLFTNEAGMDAFQQTIKQDAMNSGISFTVGDNDKFVRGSGQQLELNFAFNSFVTRETGRVTVSHLKELDLPQSNLEFGQNKKSTPIWMVFNVSPTSGGGLTNNIREVRRQGVPNMEWGYIDGTRSHLGAFKSQGMQSANKFPGYEIWMKDRYDVFIEDMSRTVLIEEIPQF